MFPLIGTNWDLEHGMLAYVGCVFIMLRFSSHVCCFIQDFSSFSFFLFLHFFIFSFFFSFSFFSFYLFFPFLHFFFFFVSLKA